ESAAVTMLEPENQFSSRVLGFDMMTDPIRSAALEKSRNSGEISITKKLKLLSEPENKDPRGFLMLMCIYRNNSITNSIPGRRANTVGWVYSVFSMKELIEGILSGYSNELEIEVYDGNKPDQANVLYDPDTLNVNNNKYLHYKRLWIDILGHKWTIIVKPVPSIKYKADFQKPQLVFISGNLMGLMLAIITWLLINGRARALEIAEQNETRYKTLMQQVNAAVLLMNMDRRIIDANEGATSLYGYSLDELLKMKHEDLFPDTLRDDAVRKFDVIKANGVLRTETKYHHRDGRIIPAEANCRLITSGEESFVLIFSYDISDRKKAEARLKESERKYRAIFENVQDVVYQTDLKGTILEISPSVYRYSGHTPEELIGKSVSIVYNNLDDRNTLLNIMKEKGEVTDYELILKAKDGTRKITSISSHLIFDKDGNCIGIEGSLRDISERKNTEMQLAKYTEELKILNATKDKFFSIISHDLRGPLSGFLGAAEMLADFADSLSKDELRKLGKELFKSAQGQFRLLEDLLSWSKMESGRMPFKPQTISCYEEIQMTINLLSATAANKKMKLCNSAVRDCFVYADPQMIQILLRNLISNAIKFSFPEKEIIISAEKIDDHILLSVRDFGTGMSQQVKERLFRLDEHYSSEGTSGEKGTGLGLILCSDIAKKHGGKIWVESEQGKGSVFFISFPLEEDK
ncbi:MAG: PAS domain S-box protein, partial [Syntrophothermus sp.]